MQFSDFKEKKVVIFGLGGYKYGSGISAAKFFIKQGAKVLITDAKTGKDLKEAVAEVKKFSRQHKNWPTFILGKHRARDFQNANIVIRNPGVPADNKFLKIARRAGADIHTDVSLFLQLLKELSCYDRNKIILLGITGTRGKSTTSALLAEILSSAGKKVFLGGNLGYSPLNFINAVFTKTRKRRKHESAYVVLELSSWQVESLDDWKISLPYAVITNIYPDHLNTYKSMRDYINAKAVIFKYQKPSDILVLNKDNKITSDLAKRTKSRVIWFSKLNLAKLSRRNLDYLPGEHNLENISAALSMASALGIERKKALMAVKKFRSLPGRLEFTHEIRGVKFYNDTTSTMPEAAIMALRTLSASQFSIFPPKADQPRVDNSQFLIMEKKIILIAGGADKKLNYRELAKEIPKYVKTLILFKGDASEKIIKEFSSQNSVFRDKNNLNSKFYILNSVSSMREAVRLAWKSAKRGDVILLSPAAASFNMFRNEFDRGEQFIQATKKLI